MRSLGLAGLVSAGKCVVVNWMLCSWRSVPAGQSLAILTDQGSVGLGTSQWPPHDYNLRLLLQKRAQAICIRRRWRLVQTRAVSSGNRAIKPKSSGSSRRVQAYMQRQRPAGTNRHLF